MLKKGDFLIFKITDLFFHLSLFFSLLLFSIWKILKIIRCFVVGLYYSPIMSLEIGVLRWKEDIINFNDECAVFCFFFPEPIIHMLVASTSVLSHNKILYCTPRIGSFLPLHTKKQRKAKFRSTGHLVRIEIITRLSWEPFTPQRLSSLLGAWNSGTKKI